MTHQEMEIKIKELEEKVKLLEQTQKWIPVSKFADVANKLPSHVKEQEVYDFVKWVAGEIFDEWEYNKDTFAEIAYRKLAKMGIVRVKDDKLELVELQESEDMR